MTTMNQTLYRALKEVKTLRPLIQINRIYAKQLLALEKEIFGKNSLPSEWMDPGEIDKVTGDVSFKHDHLNSLDEQRLSIGNIK